MLSVQTKPYSIYANPRPIRHAFIFDHNEFDTRTIEEVFQYNQTRWGGRFNLLIPSDGISIAPYWWSLLLASDPDRVTTFIDLSEELADKISSELNPYLFDKSDQKRMGFLAHDSGIKCYEIKENFRLLERAIFNSKLSLVKFYIYDELPVYIKNFLKFNFGAHEFHSHVTKQIENDKSLEKKEFTIHKIEDLIHVFEVLSEDYSSLYYESELGLLGREFYRLEHNDECDRFPIIIGSNITSLAYYWNRTSLADYFDQNTYFSLWVPEEIVVNHKDLFEAALDWCLNLYTRRNNNFIKFTIAGQTSTDLSLNALAAEIKENHKIYTHVKLLDPNAPQKIKIIREGRPSNRSNNFYRLYSDSESFNVTPNIEINNKYLQGSFMCDLYIEDTREQYHNRINSSGYWWQFPRKNRITNYIFKKPSKVLKSRYPSLLLSIDETRVDFKLPDTNHLFSFLMNQSDTMNAFRTDDLRYQKNKKYNTFDEFSISSNGKYFRGLIKAFGSLDFAYQVLASKFWQTVFKNLCPTKESPYIPALTTDGFYQRTKDELKSLHELTGKKHQHDKEHILSTLQDLVEQQVLQMGIEPICHICSSPNWIAIKDMKESFECLGCFSHLKICSEYKWKYRLNNLVRIGIQKQGLVPLVLALGKLTFEAKDSFTFTNSYDVKLQSNNKEFIYSMIPNMDVIQSEIDVEKIDTDIDLICNYDGKLVIGELKQSVSLFEEKDFTQMKAVAKLIKPDGLIFSAMDEVPNEFVIQNIRKLRDELSDLNIDIGWYSIDEHPYIFDYCYREKDIEK